MSQHILIVEDDEPLRSLFKIYLERADFIVTDVPSGIEALKVIDRENIALALIDINLEEELSGLELIEQIRKNPQLEQMKIVTLTSFPQAFDRAHPNWINLALNKPIQSQQLIEEIKQLLDS